MDNTIDVLTYMDTCSLKGYAYTCIRSCVSLQIV